MSGIDLAPEETNIGRLNEAITQLAQGRSNAVGEVTLTAGATTTVVDKSVSVAAVNVALGSQVFLTPRTANAAGALPTTWISAVDQGTFTITHANMASVDRTYGWACFG